MLHALRDELRLASLLEMWSADAFGAHLRLNLVGRRAADDQGEQADSSPFAHIDTLVVGLEIQLPSAGEAWAIRESTEIAGEATIR
jgi:hypothetical protein